MSTQAHMTDSKASGSGHDKFMQLAQEEMMAFERRENEFRKQVRSERAALLRLPIGLPAACDNKH